MSHNVLGEQMDLLAEHFRGNAIPATHEAPLTRTSVAPDKNGNILYLGISDPGEGGEHEARAYRQGPDGEYSRTGFMSTMQKTPGHPDSSVHEVEDIWVNHEHRRQGIGSALYKYSRQFLDVRHSGIRSDDGAAWTHSVGGPDMAGVDTSTYVHAGKSDPSWNDPDYE